MDKRIAKRHKRQVNRAKEKVVVTEPDLRTHEQIEAAREASGAGKHDAQLKIGQASRSMRGNAATSTGSAAKTDG